MLNQSGIYYRCTGNDQENFTSRACDSAIQSPGGICRFCHCAAVCGRPTAGLWHRPGSAAGVFTHLYPPDGYFRPGSRHLAQRPNNPLPRFPACSPFPGTVWPVRHAHRLSGRNNCENLPSWAVAVYYLNPMAGIVEGFRWSILGGAPPNAYAYISFGVVVVIFVSALLLPKSRAGNG